MAHRKRLLSVWLAHNPMLRLLVGDEAAAKEVWRWTPPAPETAGSAGGLPGNKADEQFVKQDSSESAFSCDYTGRFDGGMLPAQRQHPGHVRTLMFLSAGREAALKEIAVARLHIHATLA